MVIVVDTSVNYGARIRVVGVGGGGGNAINSMIVRGLAGVDFIAANTDIQALTLNLAPTKIQVGRDFTKGLGAGADPAVGQRSIEENVDEVRDALSGSDMVFVTAGMGGGTGTGGAPVVARIARELGALVVGIVTKPFDWEAKRRSSTAEIGIAELRKHVDALIVVPNQKLMNIIDRHTSFKEAFQRVDDVLYNATRGIADIINGNGYINVDFADVRTIMKDMGDALMGIGVASGENRAIEAAQNALNSPLLEGISISGAQGILINISGGNLTMHEIGEAVQIIENAAGSEVNLIHGIVIDEQMDDKIMITVVATGFKRKEQATVLGSITSAEHTRNTPQIVQQAPQIVQQAPPRPITINTNVAASSPTIVPITKEMSEYTPRSGNANVIPARPVGVDELSRLGTPAMNRRNNGSIPIQQAAEQPANYNRTTNNLQDSRYAAVAEKPAFLRKIMD
ncbi:MAG: cell division protein FtsZ [Bacteroidetes bacterium]|nr:cell division protein FtsZ [Bacteroidota bacterium]